MNRIITLAGMLLLFALAGYAQNKADIKGRIVDSLTNEPLEFATVATLDLKDSSLVSYTLSIKGGAFALHKLPSDKRLKLVVSFVGYKNFRKTFTLEKGVEVDFGEIKLASKGSLNQVNINAEASPVVMRKDTIEFNAEAFKTPPNAVVEELLKKLPGIQVDMDGTITVNGKKVNKLLIDGKQFFANDPKIASRNLDASLIDKVQVYDDRENDPDHIVPDSKVEKIINLKLKSAIKKSTIGKIKAGIGTEDRYDAGLIYSVFRDTLQVSLIGIGNNLNRTGFSNQELTSQGGFNRSGSDALYNGSVATGGRNYGGGIQTVGSGGLNINTDYGKKLKLNFLYFYSYTSNVSKSSSFNQQFLTDTISSSGSYEGHSSTNNHAFSALVEWKPDTVFNLRYNPRLNFSNSNSGNSGISSSYSNVLPQLNSSSSGGSNNSNNLQFQQSFSYYRKLHKKGESLNINHNLNIRPGKSFDYSSNNFISYSSAIASSNLYRLGNNINNTADGSLGITYRYPFSKKLTGSVELTGKYNQNTGRLMTFNENLSTGQYDGYIDSLSHNLERQQFTETLRPELTYQLTKQARLSVNLGVQLMQTNNKFNRNIADINRRSLYLLPAFRFNTESFSVDYSEYVDQPSINDLLPQTTVYSQLYSRVGNPDLQATRTHNIYFSYYKYQTEKMLNTNFYASISVYENSIFNERTVSPVGATVSKNVNKDGRYYTYAGMSIGKSYKKINDWQFKFNSRVSINLDHDFFQVNNLQGYQNRLYLSYNQQFTLNWNNKFDITPTYSISPNITSYQNVTYNTLKYVTQSLDVPISIRAIKHMTIEGNYNFNYNPLVSSGFQKSSNLLNFAIARQFQYRDRGEIRLSVYDLLNQNISSYRYADGNSVTDYQSQILKRYFLLSYTYRIAATVTAKKPVKK
ncbi:outer membrane beta-barrel protein [Mucilaginibacter sp. HMF5004]|uniref:outer membrane beta-barrel protein n=1 Tax=Mucilaginibacter rivuli TaxID=2857527 RepID=UPI001C5EEEC7|nr:outer membrane beta-barrel protein [Mucilaginibacter rivuli]MBW4891720.1 outer membrane beta-barrel protein [Mucilaginibacter rivuli]